MKIYDPRYGTVLALIGLICVFHGPSLSAAPSSYLRANDHIVFIGDSITEGGIYGRMVETALNATYPDAGLKAVSQGSGGKTAEAGKGLLSAYLGTQKPTIVAIMFGANDTGWAAGGREEKAAAFTNNLHSIVALCREQKIDVVLIKTSHFSHNANPDAWVDGINGTLTALFAAQDAFAKSENIPVIDGYGAYTNALRTAWQADRLYEFTPDVIHPLEAGGAALAAGILDGLGVGLPLSAEERGPIHAASAGTVRLDVESTHGVSSGDGKITLTVKLKNSSDDAVSGTLTCTAGHWSDADDSVQIPAGEEADVRLTIPEESLRGRYSCDPVHVMFAGDTQASSAQSLFHHSRIMNLSTTAFAWRDISFSDVQAAPDKMCPVKMAMVYPSPGLTVSLAWKDNTIVPAEAGFKSRFGQLVETPLNLNSRPGDQRYDAVELIFDLRPATSTARYTSSSDGNPEGIVRIGVFRKDADGAAGITVHPASAAKDVILKQEGSDRVSVCLKQALPGHFSMAILVTDTSEPGKVASVHYLGGDHPLDPMGHIRMSQKRGANRAIFWRIGY